MRRLLPSRGVPFRPSLPAWRVVPLFLALLVSLAPVSFALAATYNITITAPTPKATGLGTDVTVTVDTGGLALVPGPQATGPTDLHIHYMLDVDAAQYLDGKVAVPTGNPNIVHSAETSHTFTGLAPGAHTVTVLLTDSTHHAVQPPVHPSVTFTVGSASPTSSQGDTTAGPSPSGTGTLPKTGGFPAEVLDLLAAVGGVLVFLGVLVRRRGLRPVRQAVPTDDHPASLKRPGSRS